MRKRTGKRAVWKKKSRIWAAGAMSFAAATQVGATELSGRLLPTYRVDEPTTFTLTNAGIQDYVLTWVDDGVTNSVRDPVLILSKDVTYTFFRASTSHPFGLVSESMPVTSSFDFSLKRDTTSPSEYLLENGAALSGNPASQPDSVVWTPAAEGEFYYTCMVAAHPDMTGRIQVIEKPQATAPAITDFAVIADFGAVVVSNVVANQVLLVQATDSLAEAPFETKAAVLVEFELEEVFIQDLTNRYGFVRAIIE